MINALKKINSNIKKRGLSNTLNAIFNTISFESKCFFTGIKLELKKGIGNENITVNHGNYYFNFYNRRDRGEILYHACWDRMFKEERDKIEKYIKKGDTVIDVGGNMGFFVLILNNLMNDSGKIYSFEPSGRLSKKLSSTVKINNLKNVEIINLALGEQEGATSLYFNPKQSGLSSIVTQDKNDFIVEEIKITTLDKFSNNISERISFIKIDTEGYEPQVLRGAKETIKKHKPTIYLELGGDHFESSIESLKILKEFGYQCEAENIDLKTIPAGVNFIATPKL